MNLHQGLPEKAVKKHYMRMNRRLVFSGPLLWIATGTVLQSNPNLWHDSFAVGLFLAILICIVYRVVIHINHLKILSRKNGLRWFRLFFSIGAVSPALAFGLLAAHVVLANGAGFAATAALSSVIGITAMATMVGAFDLLVTLLLQAVVFWPVTFVLIFHFSSQSGVWPYIAVNSIFYAVMGVFAFGLNRRICQEILSYEALLEEKERYKAANAEAHENSQMVNAMFESVAEGFLIFDKNGFCFASPSIRAKKVFGQDPTGLHISELLKLSNEERDEFNQWFRMVYEEKIPFQILADTRKRTVKVGARTLNVRYHDMRSQDDKILGIVMTAADMTAEADAQKLAQEAAERADLILRINENRKEFQAFLNDFERVVSVLKNWNGTDIEGLRRDIHTLKGSAALFGARGLSRRVHGGELLIVEALAKAGDKVENVKRVISQISEDFHFWRAKEMALFAQLGVFQTETLEVSERRLSELERAYQGRSDALAILHDLRKNASIVDIGEQLKDYESHIQATARKLGKKVDLLVVRSGEEILVHPQVYREVLRSMVHLLNNSLDHGIETPAERLRIGKPEVAKIKIEYGRILDSQKRQIVIRFSDDGRGIDIARMRAAMIKKGNEAAREMSDREVSQSIFSDGLTTTEKVSDISGQGIGMGAVRMAILKARGSIKMIKTDSSGTEFEIILPDLSILDSKVVIRTVIDLAKAN
jgi:two-component system, chemotaxis family, sensor kinase CheA